MTLFSGLYPASSKPASLGVRLAVMALFAGVFTAFQIQHSLAVGRLSTLPQYDDVVYLINGLERLAVLREGGVGALADHLWNRIVWSPWSVLAATLGYALFGPVPWALYAVNGLLVFGLLGLTDWATGPARLAVKIPVYALCLALPLAGHTVTDFRPDFAAAFATAAAILATLRMSSDRAGRRAAVLAGVFTALALLAKPTVFAATFVFVGFAGLVTLGREVAMLRRAEGDRRWRSLAVNIALATAACLALAALHFGRYWRLYFDYFWVNTFGDRARHWDRNLDGLENFGYFFTGPGGRLMFDGAATPLLAITIAGVVAAALRTAGRPLARFLAQVGVVAAFALVLPATNSTKNPYFGLVFATLWLLITSASMRHLLADAGRLHAKVLRGGSVALAIVLLGWTLAKANFPAMTPGAITPTSREGFDPAASNAYAEAVARAVAETIPEAREAQRARGERGQLRVHLTTSGFLNKDTLGYLLLRLGLDRPHLTHAAFTDDLGLHTAEMGAAHVIVTFEPGVADERGAPLLHGMMPATAVVGDINARAAEAGWLEPVARIPSPAGPAALVYLRTDAPPEPESLP